MKEIVMLNNSPIQTKMTLQSFDELKTTIVMDNKEFQKLKEDTHAAGYEAGYAAGFLKAENDTREVYEAGIVNALNIIQNDLVNYTNFQNIVSVKTNDQLAYFFKVILQKMFPILLKKHGFLELTAFIESMQSVLLNHDRISIKVGPLLNAYINDHMPSLHTLYCILEQDDLPPFFCQITWPNGGAELDLEKKLKVLDSSIESFFQEASL